MGKPVFLPGRDEAVPAHFGEPLIEQRKFAEGEAVVDASHRGVVRVSGPDRASWLHSLTTAHISARQPGESFELLVLSPRGHIEHHARVVAGADAMWLTVETGHAGDLASWLDSMKFMKDVEVVDVTSEWACVLAPSALAEKIAHQTSPPVWRNAWPTVQDGSCGYGGPEDESHPGHELDFCEVLIPRPSLDEVLQDVPHVGYWAFEALRVAAWLPRFGLETDHRTIPHEIDWLRTTVHLTKGCYRGQETVARVKNLGKPPRRLAMVHLDGSDHVLPEVGADVVLGDRVIGRLTSVAQHYVEGPIGLVVVRRATDDTAELTVGGIPASQVRIVR